VSFDLRIENGDISFQNGQIETVTNEDKLVQSLVRILLTPLGEVTLRPYYGTNLGGIITRPLLPDFIFITKIEDSVKEALEFLMQQQSIQSRYQYVSPGEEIREILSVMAERSPSDPRQINVGVAIRAGSGDVVAKTFTISPGAIVQVTGGVVTERGGF